MINHDRCPLCTSDKIAFYLRCTDHLVSKEEFDIFRCKACGFVFTQGSPDEKHIEAYYNSEKYISHNDKAKGLLNRIYIMTRHLMLSRKRIMVEALSGGKKGDLLDIGCGTGHFPMIMKKSAWNVTGIEPNAKARDFASKHFGISIRQPDEISKINDHSFDVITFWHVLEHLHDPFKYSSETARLLKPGGICIVAAPNCSSSDAYHYKQAWAAYDVPRHLWHFNASTIKSFWVKKDFDLVDMRRLPLDVFYISILSEKNMGRRMPFVKGTMKGIWFSLKSAIDKENCSSLIFILKKRGA